MDLKAVKIFISSHVWVGSIVAFFIGFLFGPGFIWQYKNIEISERRLLIDKIKVENDIRKQMVDLQNDISNKAKEYIEVRDRYRKEKGKNKMVEYSLQNQYLSISSTMVKLFTDYNILEIKLSQLETRGAVYFSPARIIPPPAPKDLEVKKGEDGHDYLVAKWEEDEVTKVVWQNIENLCKQYGIEIRAPEKKPQSPR